MLKKIKFISFYDEKIKEKNSNKVNKNLLW